MDSSYLFLPELLLVASIMAIPALHIATENRRSYYICSNVSLFLSFLLLVLFWFYPDEVSFDKTASAYVFYDHFKIDDFSQLFKVIFVLTALTVSVVSTAYFDETEPGNNPHFDAMYGPLVMRTKF